MVCSSLNLWHLQHVIISCLISFGVTVFCGCSYGTTSDGKLVDSAGLQLLENMGFERALAAEALKQVCKLLCPSYRLCCCALLDCVAPQHSFRHLHSFLLLCMPWLHELLTVHPSSRQRHKIRCDLRQA